MAVYEDMLAAKQREREAAAREARQETMRQEAPEDPGGAQEGAASMTLEEALRLGLVTLAPGTGQAEQAERPAQEQARPEQPEQARVEAGDEGGPAEVVRTKRKRTRHHARRDGAERREAGPEDAIMDLSGGEEADVAPEGAVPEAATPAEDGAAESARATADLARAAEEEDEALRSILSESMGDGRAAAAPGEEAVADAPVAPDDTAAPEEPGEDGDVEDFTAAGAEDALAGLSDDGTPDGEDVPESEPAMDGAWQGQDAEAEEELLNDGADEGYPWEDAPDGAPGDRGFTDAGTPEFFDAPEDPDVWSEAENLALSVISGGGAYEVSDGVRDAAVRILQDAISDLGGTVSERVVTEAYDAIMEIQQAVIEANSRYINAQRDLMCATDGMERRREEARKAMESYDRLVGKKAGRTD